jgi:hypothetical protein
LITIVIYNLLKEISFSYKSSAPGEACCVSSHWLGMWWLKLFGWVCGGSSSLVGYVAAQADWLSMWRLKLIGWLCGGSS